MLITRTNPKGIDWYIQNLQTHIHGRLVEQLQLSPDTSFECYGRCYRNKTDNGYTAEIFTGGNDYKEVYWQDSLSAISFFGITNGIRVGINNEADVHLVVFANLSKLALTDQDGAVIAHRSDEELRTMVQAIIGKASNGFTLQGIETGIENVLREYPGSRREERLKYVDMHPVHSFRINLKLVYNPNKNC